MAGLRIVVAAVALACALGVAGCQSNPEPAPLPSAAPSTSVSSATPSPSPSVTPPTMPADARGTSKKSAKAFVRYYVDTLNYAAATGNTDKLRSISAKHCEACRGIYEKIERTYAAGGYFKGDGWTVVSLSAVEGQPLRRPILQATVSVAPQDVRDESAGPVRHFDGGKQPMDFRLARSGAWQMVRIDRAA